MTPHGFGHGKVILIGEHAVVYGQPALAVGLDVGVRVRLVRGGPRDLRVAEAFDAMARHADINPSDWGFEVSAQIPLGAGLGGSAAFSVATAKALLAIHKAPATEEAILALANVGEEVFHGNPSGIDATVACRGGFLRFVKGRASQQLRAPEPIPLVIADTGERGNTRAQVDAVAQRREEQGEATEALFDILGVLAGVATEAIPEANWKGLGSSMDAAHSVLQRIGVSTERLDTGCKWAREAGALGAKLTGAGGGGCLIALAPDPDPVLGALDELGMASFYLAAGAPSPTLKG